MRLRIWASSVYLSSKAWRVIHHGEFGNADDAEHKRSWFVYAPRLDPRFDRDDVIGSLDALGISSKPYLPCIHLQPYYQDEHGHGPGEFPVTEAISASTIALPFFPEMTESQVDQVCEALATVLRA